MRSRDGVHRLGCAVLLLLLFVWQATAWSGLVRPIFLSSPIAILRAPFGMNLRELADAVLISARTYALGMAVTIVVGVPLGLALGLSRYVNAALSPLLAILQAMPRVAFAPFLILWLGIGATSVVALIVMNAVVMVVATTATGVRQIDPRLPETAFAFRASRAQVIRTVTLPASVPHMLAGIRLAVGRGLLSLVVGEFLTSSGGVGYLIRDYASAFQTDRMFVGIGIVTVAGLVLNAILEQLERRLESWRPA
jgi:ABC-type nitrate/sulfonate/bicarbonate transport system permease component